MPTIVTWIEELAAHLPALREIEKLKAIKEQLEAQIKDLTDRKDQIETAYTLKATNAARDALAEREAQIANIVKAKEAQAQERLEAVYAEMRSAEARKIAARDEAALQEQRLAEALRVSAVLRKQLMGDAKE